MNQMLKLYKEWERLNNDENVGFETREEAWRAYYNARDVCLGFKPFEPTVIEPVFYDVMAQG